MCQYYTLAKFDQTNLISEPLKFGKLGDIFGKH